MKRKGKSKTGRLQPKLTIMVLIIVFAAFLIVTVGVITYFSSIYKSQEIRNQQHQLDQCVEQIRFLQTTAENIAVQIATDTDMQVGIMEQEEISAAYSLTKRNIHQTLLTYAHIMDSIQEITIYTDDKRTFSSAEMRGDFYPDSSEWYLAFKDRSINSGYTAVHLSTQNQYNLVEDVISYVLTYYSIRDTREKMGDIIISLDYSALQDILELDMSMLNGYCLYDDLGNPILQQGEVSVGYAVLSADKNSDTKYIENGNILVISDEMNDGWILVTEINREKMDHQMITIGFFLTMIFTLIAFLLWLVLALFIRRVVNPIKQLNLAAVEVGNGNFDVNIDIQTNDELEVMANAFNTMVIDIKKLMEESVEHEKVTRKLQIDQLMLQINPHFIYNTLNSIVYMARMNGNRDIAEFANAFISLLQSTLRIRDTIFISLEEELINVENYVLLQKYRYIGKFDLEVIVPKELLHCAIPGVMLQPLVENAIFHGLAAKEEKGLVTISVQKKDKILEISVCDDGVGMTKDVIERLMTEGQGTSDGMRKIGIENVRNRIHQIFGEEYDMRIESIIEKGTKIIINIPFQSYIES